jgi:hypothetical protein
MVESSSASEFDVRLGEEWARLAATQEATRTFLEQNVHKRLPDEPGAPSLGLYAFYNKKLASGASNDCGIGLQQAHCG